MSDSLLEPIPFNGGEAGPMDLATAAIWTADERERSSGQAKAYFFGRDIIKQILAQDGCMGLRVYYAFDPVSGKRHLLMVGADADQNDQLPPLSAPPGADKYIIAEMALACPNNCGVANDLNSSPQL